MKAANMRHIPIFVLTVSLCFSTSLLWAQTGSGDVKRDFHGFREQFDEVINRSSDDSAAWERFMFPKPERLPYWLFSLPSDKEKYTYVVAASDPGMTAQAAKELALLRAQIMFGLLSATHVGHIREYYATERDREVTHFFTEYTRFTGQIQAYNEQVEVVRQHTTQYDETIILARIPIRVHAFEANVSPFGQIEAGLFSRLRGIGNRMQLEEHLYMEVTPERGTAGSHYQHQYAMINRIVNTSTTIDDMLITDLPALNLRYSILEGDQQNMKTNRSDKDGGVSLSNGFWHALVACMLSSMVDIAHDGSIHFTQLNDISDLMMLSMSRELMQKTLISNMPVMFVDNNKLYLYPFVQQIIE